MTNSPDVTGCINSDFDFENLQESWTKYWDKSGEKILLNSWLSKYGDYAKSEQDDKTDENYEINKSCESELENYDSDWKVLWDKHCEEEYYLRYREFCERLSKTLYKREKNECYVETKIYSQKELEDSLNKNENSSESDEVEYVILDEGEKLSFLGLPISLGNQKFKKRKRGKRSSKSKVKKNSKSEFDIENHQKIEIKFEDPFLNMDVEGLISFQINKNKNKKIMRNKRIPEEIRNNTELLKFWNRRFSLFSLFNNGIKLDEESWFSVTPEKVAAGIAERLKCDLIIDAFCGCGGNTIQFALKCNHVIAIDIDPIKIDYAKNNAKIYGVDHKIDFIIGDFLKIYEKFKANTIFLSPPWGGPNYLKNENYDIENNLQPIPASELIEKCRKITNNIVFYLPKNSNIQQIIKLAGPEKSVEVSKHYINDKIVAITASYGDLVTDND